MTMQERNEDARPLPGSQLYDVNVTIPDIGGETPEDAAQVFWDILKSWTDGDILSPVWIRVREIGKGPYVGVLINPVTGEVVPE